MEGQTCERGTGNLMAKILGFVCGDKRVEFLLYIYGKILNNNQIPCPSKLKKKSYSNCCNNYHRHPNLWKHNNITKYCYYIAKCITKCCYYTSTGVNVSSSDVSSSDVNVTWLFIGIDVTQCH